MVIIEERAVERSSPVVPRENSRGGEVCQIGDVLDELLARYADRFPGCRLDVVETQAAG